MAALHPGQCVQLVKAEAWIEELPKNLDCEVTGKPMIREEEDPFWDNTFTVLYKNEEVMDCEKKAPWCDARVPR